MPMNDDDFMAVFTGQAKVSKQQYPVIPTMGTDEPYEERQRKQQAAQSGIDWTFLDDESMGTIDKLKKFWRVQTNTQTPDERLASAEKVGNALGLVPQTLAENDDLYKNALLTYEQQQNNAFLQGKPFTPQTVAQMYPELDTEDTVATTMALRDYNNILKTRRAISEGTAAYTMDADPSLWGTYKSTMKDINSLPGYIFGKISDLVTKAYNAGQAMDAQSELMYKASIGEISDEDVEKALPGLMTMQKEFKSEMGDTYVARIVGEAISQLSMQKNMMMRGAEKILAPIAPLAQPALQATKTNIPQIATLGSTATASALGLTGTAAAATVASGAAIAGLLTLGTASVFVGTYRAEAGQAYWEWRTKKGKNGNHVYTREQAIGHAKRVGMMNAAIETGAWELAFKGIAKVWGSEAASAVIKDTDAMKKLIGAGRGAIRKQALIHGGKQFAKVAIPETVEEGLQSMTSDLDTNIYGEGGISAKEMFNNALDAMVEAVPSVIGMSIGGSALGGIGAYKAMKKISGLSEMKETVTEFKRQNENAMLQKVMELREDSSLYHKAPETYRKTIQRQMDQADMGTVYIDAQAAAENESTHEALNEMVEKGIVSAKELDESIKTGKPLAVESGKYMQLASEETPEVLSDYSTMDKGERTLHAIKEERQRYKDMIDIVTSTKEKREAAASEKILNDHFSEDTEKGREDRATAQELLSGGLDHLQENYKSLLEEAKKAWGDLSGVKELQDYMERRKTQDANTSGEKGVDFIDVGEGADRVHIRESKNPDWYQDFYSDHDRAPTQRELYDVAHQKIIKEVFHDNSEDSHMGTQELEAAKAKVESLERVGEVIKTLDKKDLVAQTLLDPDTYEQAYKPLLEQITKAGNKEVTQAARDSALILAKLAENFHKNYGVPLKLATIKAGEITGLAPEALGQMAGENARTAPLEKLREAEQMEQDGAVPEEIWNKTGWLRGPEGIWRFEIPDDLEGIHLDRLSEEERYIDEIYTNEDLYEAYPDLRDTKIRIADFLTYEDGELAGANGATQGDHIILDKDYVKSDPEEAKKTIIHELQHVIQNKFEQGFSKGGSPETAKADMESTLHTLELALKSEIDTKEAQEFLDKYHEAENCRDFEKFFKINAELSAMEKKIPFEKVRAIKGYLAEIKLLKRASSVNDYTAYRMLGGETEAFMIEGRAEEYTKAKKEFIQQMNRSIKAKNTFDTYLSRHPLDKMAYRRNELDKMSDEAKTLYQDWQDIKANADGKNPYVTGKWSMPDYYFSEFGPAVVNLGRAELPFSQQNIEDELSKIKEKLQNTDRWMKAPDGSHTKLTERQWLISHSDSFKRWFRGWDTVKRYNDLFNTKPESITQESFHSVINWVNGSAKSEIQPTTESVRKNIKTIFHALFSPTVMANGYKNPGKVVNKYGENIVMPITAAKEIRRHSADLRNLYMLTHLNAVVSKATFLYEEARDVGRIKKLNQTTLSYRYYAQRVTIGNEDCIARIVVRKDKNGNLYFYDGEITSMREIKEGSSKHLYPVPKTGQSLDKPIFTHSIQEWLENVKEITDKIGENGEVLQEAINEFDKSNKYYQAAAPEKDLVAMHNIGLSNLEAAIKLGGFPVPSIAITKKQTPYTGFGDVTLIMNKDTVDPTQTPVFSRDAWTGVFPKTVRVANLKKLQDFMKNVIEPLQRELPRENADYGNLYDSNMLFNVKNKNGDVQRMLESSIDSIGFKYYFLKSINKAPKPKWVKKKLGGTFAEHPTILKACQKLEKKYGKDGLKDLLYEGPYAMLEESPDIKEVNDLLIQETTKESTEGTSAWGKRLRERRKARIANGEELHSLLWDFLKRDEKVFDSRAFETQVSKKVEVNQKAYESWKRSFRNEMLGETVIQDNGKPATLENIVDTMLGKLKNAQTSFAGYGVGNVIASSAKKMNSLKEVHEVADKKMDTSTNTETGLDDSEQYTAVKNKIMDFTNKMADAYKWENKWESYSDAARVLMAMMQGKSFKVSAKKFDFNYSAELEKQAKEIVKEVKALPVKYFEAKPQRAVRFNEVAAAVMPKNAPKEIKDYLRAQGVMIRLYDPKIDGDRERVTNSAQDRAKQYFQNGTRFQGSYDRNQNVIDIFDGANQSTVIHEGAHMFLSMLEDMSQTDTQTLLQYFNGDEKAATASMKRMQDDLSTIRNWAAYSEDHLAEYKGTALEKEFAQHAADIAAGKEGAEERWIQERFARGFEKYLMDGSAPTKEMQGVFRRFKKWLTDIYKTAKNLGNVKLTPEIKDIFDKMLATEDEINAWAAQRKLESIDKAIDVNKSELGNLKEWAENVKQKAQEKAMSYYLSMVKEDAIEQFKDSISTEEAKAEFMTSLADENELYSIEQVYNADAYPTQKDREGFLKLSGFASEKEFKQRLKESGGTSEEQWHKHIADMVQQYKDEALTPEVIKQMAEDILNSPEGLQKKSRIESMLLEKKVTQYINLVTSMQLKLKRAKDKEKVAREIRKRLGLVSEKETSELDKQADTIARSEEKISKLEKQVKTLKEKLETARKEASDAKGENKSRKESAELLENNLRAIEAELEKERAAHEKTQATQKDTEATVADLEGQLKTMVDGLRESRKGMWVNKGTLRKDAYNTMSLETISHATSWKWWQNKAKEADAKAMKCAAENDWDGVAYYKKVEAQNLIMSRQAKLNVDEIKKALHGGGKLTTKETDNNGMERYGILGLINRIGRKENPVLLQDDARYFIQHLAYMCGMTKNDAPMPIDSAGNPRPFSKQAILDMVDPMNMKQLDGASLLFDGSDVIPEWVLDTYFNFDSKPGSFNKLTMNDFRDIVKCMKAVYRIGRREYEGNTLGTSFDNAAKEIVNGLHNVSGLQFFTPFQRKHLFTDKQKKLHVIAKYARSLALPEMYIERLGPAAYNYLYKPIDIATARQREMKEQAKKDIQKIFNTYSRKEWLEIRNDRKYRILDSDELFAKEELLVIALNWGTESNRDRIKDIVREVNPTYDLNKSNWAIDLQEELETYLTDKDWDFVEKVWNHLNSYYAGRSKVQNDLYGVPMGKVPGITFTLKSGRKIRGQYYTIRYDKDLSQRTSEQSVNDMAKQGMKGATTFGIGMGSTKTRTGSGGQILNLSLDLYPKFVDEAIQHTTMREATVDVYKLLCRKDVEESIVNVMGQDGYDFLKQWVVDNWHSPIVEANDWVGFFNRMRCKFNFATMAYRTSTALLNALNIFPLMNEMGPMNALYAIAHFYKDIPYAPRRVAERYRFIKEKSSFMRDRESNMDRDMAQGMRLPVEKGESKLHSTLENGKFGTSNINRYGFWLITKTDYMLSMPQWLATYEGSKRKLQLEHPEMKIEDIDAESVRLADKAVRQTFGSGEIKDRPEIMRNGHWLGQITAFYSYTNLVANWFMRDFYKWKDTGSIRPLAESILFCWVLNAVFEGCMRAAWGDKDDDKYKNKIVNAFFNGGPIGGIPVIRDCLPWVVNYAVTGKKTGEITPDVGAMDVLNYIPRIMDATKKGDYIEVARNVNKVSNRSYLGFSDTLSDGFWSTVRFCTTENQYTLADLLRSIIFDRPLKAETKKSKKKEDKK